MTLGLRYRFLYLFKKNQFHSPVCITHLSLFIFALFSVVLDSPATKTAFEFLYWILVSLPKLCLIFLFPLTLPFKFPPTILRMTPESPTLGFLNLNDSGFTFICILPWISQGKYSSNLCIKENHVSGFSRYVLHLETVGLLWLLKS